MKIKEAKELLDKTIYSLLEVNGAFNNKKLDDCCKDLVKLRQDIIYPLLDSEEKYEQLLVKASMQTYRTTWQEEH